MTIRKAKRNKDKHKTTRSNDDHHILQHVLFDQFIAYLVLVSSSKINFRVL